MAKTVSILIVYFNLNYNKCYGNNFVKLFMTFLIIAKDVVERDAGYHEPAHGYHEPAHEISHEYAEPSYAFSGSNEYLQEMLGPDPAVSVFKINTFQKHMCEN